jgi:hypothetical protein
LSSQQNDRALVLKATPDPAGSLQATAAQQLAELGIGPTAQEVISARMSL